ncbi:uncharacterized protein EI90DRAFT_3118093 [Cantharellus anzutake]|uniref:uncharacterized protein n=1 Tax=Cantharellus anzutake TaxID=1750568 RepID=UPI001905CE79|nr:uncharacterized protein EI90DRAFT_3118093 [Cantharellus anzutake]KAF8339033.1 hypothetical protein EI90DRAFT_3118093 [Cantharellus anzutake]
MYVIRLIYTVLVLSSLSAAYVLGGMNPQVFQLANSLIQEDHEIFDLVSALEATEGKATSFYSFLGVSPSASSADIGKAYRKKSVTMHPDKNRGLKDAEERYARLGVISKILRDEAGRTGYYYSRFRPGLGSVLIFLAFLSSGIQYIILRINQKRDLKRVGRLIRLGKAAAYGPKGIPIEGKRKVRVPLTDFSDDGNRGRMVDLLVEGPRVYMSIPGDEPVLLDESIVPFPHIRDIWVLSLLSKGLSRLRNVKLEVNHSKAQHEIPRPRVPAMKAPTVVLLTRAA